MPKKENKKSGKKKGTDTEYAHNPRYCMIAPDAADPDEKDITSSGKS